MNGLPKISSARLSAPWLFGAAAVFNFTVGLGFLFDRPQLASLLSLDAITGTNMVVFNLLWGFVVLFGYAFVRVAHDPRRFRLYISLGIIGKLIAVIIVIVGWLEGQAPWTVPAIAGGDVFFAALFLLYLRNAEKI
jgi:hypothetical protein